jgi:hypothetical protein
MRTVGFLCIGVSILLGLMGIGNPSGAGFLPCVGMALVGIMFLGVADVRSRLSKIEKHLGIDNDKEEKNSNKVPDATSSR